jgi:hypothetical protein
MKVIEREAFSGEGKSGNCNERRGLAKALIVFSASVLLSGPS